ncbi:MAG TPA: dihydrofolate reductase family protein [Candidatus Dormibacteraeota bacterium]|nr:dihydrofolate reductase family protein [Candidatus Dormibacteraeota bacterium]
MRNFEVFFDDAEPSLIDHPGFAPYGKMGFPSAHSERPWTFANFVQSIDGVASFKGPHAAGSDISQSAEDRWLMDLLRAHADAIITGIHTLEEETLSAPRLNEGRGPVYCIADESLRDLRIKLGRKREKVIFVTASGSVDRRAYRVFDGDLMDALILTTEAGAARLHGRNDKVQLIVAGEDKNINLPMAMGILRKEMGIEHLLCEGGPTLYGSMARAGLIDEKFVTVSPVEIGLLVPPEQDVSPAGRGTQLNVRPTTFMFPGFTRETAPWWRWMSCRRVGDHQFNRYRRK